MNAGSARRRAPAMDPEERREAIIEAALPLVTEHGANVATRAIAQAAGIAEGTVFRVFATKDELLRACVAEAFRLDRVRAELDGIPAQDDVEDRLAEVAALFAEHFARLGELMRALATSGYDPRHAADPKAGEGADGPQEFAQALVDTVVGVLEPDAHRFEVSLDELAYLLLGLVMSLRFDPGALDDPRARVVKRVEVLLHGALRNSEAPRSP